MGWCSTRNNQQWSETTSQLWWRKFLRHWHPNPRNTRLNLLQPHLPEAIRPEGYSNTSNWAGCAKAWQDSYNIIILVNYSSLSIRVVRNDRRESERLKNFLLLAGIRTLYARNLTLKHKIKLPLKIHPIYFHNNWYKNCFLSIFETALTNY